MILQGQLFAESPIYRGNARKTLFTRDGDGTQRLVSLSGEISGTAQYLMDAFIGKSSNGKNIGLLDKMWSRLYYSPLPEGLITKVRCHLQEKCYPRDNFFDLRMGIKLDDDRWAAEANANYKMETLFRNSVFDISIHVDESTLEKEDNLSKLYYVLQELKDGRFWYGAGKSKGLGRCRLEMDIPFTSQVLPKLNSNINHLRMSLVFNTENPVLVGWNWGKIDPNIPAFAAIEGRLLIEAMRDLPASIRDRLGMVIGGPILSPEDWKRRFAEYLPKITAIWLRESSTEEMEGWVISSSAIKKLGKGKYALAQNLLDILQTLTDRLFADPQEAETALKEALGKKANMAKRVLESLERKKQARQQFNHNAWLDLAKGMRFDLSVENLLAPHIQNENELIKILTKECNKALPGIYQQIDQQVKLLQSDAWIDNEIADREEHVRIKNMIFDREIDERQWRNPERVPEGIRASVWEEFLDSHSRVQFHHMLNTKNLSKSITNDDNYISFLKAYRNRSRQELSQPNNTDFRAGGIANREISKKYGKPYDTIFMRMLTWTPSSQDQGQWEVYLPGSTIKGAFRKRATQVLKTLWGETKETTDILDRLFGKQGQRGAAFFSDAYLKDPNNPQQSWCSMDGVRMDPRTGKPIEEAKADYLYPYGDELLFQLNVDIQDIDKRDMKAIALLNHLLIDFQKGDIPLGGEKSNGFGWVKADFAEINWLTTNPADISRKLFGKRKFVQDGIWEKLTLTGDEAVKVLHSVEPLLTEKKKVPLELPKSNLGFISHRAFGGYCGMLAVEAEASSPICVQESGEPSFKATLKDGPVNGWDFFSIASPEAANRGSDRVYALPSKSIKGMIRHIYCIASDSKDDSSDIAHLNPVDSLFGWVGSGTNQAIMGRLSIGFGKFEKPKLAWFKVPYPYGEWQFNEEIWKKVPNSFAKMFLINDQWRLFLNTPLAPIVDKLESFQPDTAQASYFRAILPSARCQFSVRFWNLEKKELQRLIWSLVLEPDMAHKAGRSRYLGFGSLKLRLLPESFLTDWAKRYSKPFGDEWRLPIKIDEWIDTQVIKNYIELRKALDAKQV